jgi:hypothetical protein
MDQPWKALLTRGIPDLLAGGLGGIDTVPRKIETLCNTQHMTVALYLNRDGSFALFDIRHIPDPMALALRPVWVGTFGPDITAADVEEQLAYQAEQLAAK